MKKWFTFVLMSICTTILVAQNTFQIDYNVGLLDLTGSVHQNTSDGYLVSGMTSAGLTINGVLYETDDAGTLVWAKDYNGGFFSPIGFFDARQDGTGYIATGSAMSSGFGGNEQAFLMSTDGAGNVNWGRIFGGPTGKADYSNKVKLTSDGGYIMVGGTQSFGPTDSTNVYVVKVDGTGNMQWDIAIRPDPTNDSNHDAKDVVEIPGDGYYVTGYTSEIIGPDTLTEILAFKLDLSGNLVWINKYGANNDYEEGASITLLPGNELLITGYTDATPSGLDAGDVCFLRLNTSGTVLSSSAYDMGFADLSNSGQLTSDGHYLSIGWTIQNLFPLSIAAYLLKVNSTTGAVMLAQQYTAGIGTLMSEGQETTDGGYVIASMSGTTGWNYHVVKTDGSAISGCLENSYGAVLRAYSPPAAVVTPATHTGSSQANKNPTVSNISPVITVDCISVTCTPPPDPTATATPATICAGQTSTITGSGSGPGITYNVYDSPTGGTLLGAAPLGVTPGTTTTYYVEADDGAGCVSANRTAVTVTVIPVDDPSWTAPGTQCETGGPIDLTTYITGTSGGTFSGTGVSGNNFDPSAAGAGTHTITYTVGTVPCEQTQNQNITVEPDVNPAWTAPGVQCETGGAISLTPFITGTGGGSFSGPGVSGSNFDPAVAGAGTHTITYTVGNAPCQESQNQNITVEPDVDPTWTNPGVLCETGAPVDLSTLVTGTAGGTFSGTGVTGTNFDPAAAGAGTHAITYTVGNAPCQESLILNIDVISNPDPSWTAPSVQCEAGSPIDLTTFVTGTSGGTFSGTGVSGNNFDPAVAGAGSHTITYTVGTAPCLQSQNQTITVEADVDPSWTAPATQCETGGLLDLTTLVTGTTGGTFSGTGVTGSNFDPAAAGAGTYTITYTVGNAPCQESQNQSVTVEPDVDASWTDPSPICAAAGSINLDALVTGTAGGTWSGTGVTGSNFNPASGSQTVTYTVGNSPCDESMAILITVEPDVDASWTDPSPVCVASGSINLDALVTGTAGGTWSGTGVTGNMWDPSGGSQTVTYTVGNAPCDEALAFLITVEPDVDPSWTSPGTVCEDAGIFDLNTFVTGTAGGTWSGTGVSGSNFDPTGLSGSITVTYSVGNAPCAESQNQTIDVVPDVDPSWSSPGAICESSGPIDLNTLLTGTGGGTWSGTNVTGSMFDPTGLSGSINITYTVGTAPCVETLMQAITVTSAVSAAWTSPGTICEAAGPIDLSTLVTGSTGGTWSGSGVSGNIFDPTGQVGGIVITYDVGVVPCNDSENHVITVEPDVDPGWTSPGAICEVGGPIDLNTLITGTTGGTWSGTNVSGSTFDPAGLTGMTISITYTVGNAPCEETSVQTIDVTNIDGSWTAPGPLCESDGPVNLDALVTGTAGGSWSGSGVTGSTFDPVGQSGTVNITYTVGTVPCQDVVMQSVTVNASPVDPTVSATNGTICEGDTTTILATGSGGGVTYNIYDAPGGTLLGTTPMIFGPSTTTTYYIEAVNVNGCVNLGGGQPVTITVNPLPLADAGATQTICLGDSADLVATGGGTYLWSTTETTPNITVYPTSGTYYYVTVTDANSCSATDSVLVDVTTPGSVLAADDAGNTDNVTTITIDAGINDAGDVNSITIITPPANGTATATGGGMIDYTPNAGFIGTDSIQYVICDPFCANACDTAWIRIEVIDEIQLGVPTGVSPNGDGMNDFWVITGLEKYPDHQVLIFNRWGDLIFEAAPYNNDWAGQSNNTTLRITGDEVVDGTYFWVIDLGDETTEIQKGSLELRRK